MECLAPLSQTNCIFRQDNRIEKILCFEIKSIYACPAERGVILSEVFIII